VSENRLARETSPYLLQHAHNPVDWFPWGEEALAKAKADDKPILLSVGYSACHWCHVMERESFENPDIAAVMNRHFVNVKVDREERPDVDQIYMQAVQSLTGHGGWPMTVFLTPDGIPFYGGTYYPPTDRHGLPGFPRLLEALADAWRPYVDVCLESFGASRCMFESNFPVDKGSYPYAAYWNACKVLAKGASVDEKRDLFSGTAARFYRLEV